MPMHKAYRAEWNRMGYGTHMGSSEVCRPPSASFRRVYHFSNSEFALRNLNASRLKVARFSDANDPFELMGLNLRDSSLRVSIEGLKNSVNELHGMICFSQNWTSPLLWSHYADDHKGICLGFDVPAKRLERVTYERDRMAFAALDRIASADQIPTELRRRLLTTKFRGWNYEREHRMLVELHKMQREDGLYFCPFGNELQLREVILGVRCKESLTTMRELVGKQSPSVTCIDTRLAWKFFNIVPDEKSVL